MSSLADNKVLDIVWANESSVESEVFHQIIDEYEEMNPDIKINLIVVPFSELDNKITTMTIGGEAPDIARMSNINKLSPLLLDLNDYLGEDGKKDLYDNFLETNRVWAYQNGRQVAIPIDFMVMFLAGLQGIPSSYYEAAKIDGASKWQEFRHIIYPLLKPTGLVVIILSTIQAVTGDFKEFKIISMSVPDNRNMVLFPEKINNKYVRLERPFAVYGKKEKESFDIWISESPDLGLFNQLQKII